MKTHSRFLPPVMHGAIFSSMAAVLTVVTLVANAEGDCLPSRESAASSTQVSAANRELAIRRFQLGNALLEKQDFEGALDLFLRSRALWYHWANSLNAAICLTNLGRYHEALAFYEDILRDFRSEIDIEEREQITKTIGLLEKRVLRIQVDESAGTLKVDSEVCGALPRAEAIYLLPGVHVFRILHSGNPERSVLFDGHAGAIQTLRMPPLPAPPPPSAPVIPNGHWFVQIGGGAAIGWTEIGQAFEMSGGYRWPNQLAVGLSAGALPVESAEESRTSLDNRRLFRYRATLAQFMGISASWEPLIDNHFAALFGIGFGIWGGQSKNVIEVNTESGRVSIDELGFLAEGRNIARWVTPYAAFKMGFLWHVQRIRIGLSFGLMVPFEAGPELDAAQIINPYADKPTKFVFNPAPSYNSSVLFLPQIVFEYDP